MAPTHVLDNYYLAITAIVTVGFQLACFLVAYSCQFDKITDLAGGLNFTMLAILTLTLSGAGAGVDLHPRQLVVSLFMIAWSVRLAGFLFFRILKTGKDERFNDMRGKFLSFLGFWVFQMLWVWTVSLPVTLLNSPNVTRYPQRPFGTGRDVAGVVLFAVGFVFEAGGDVQKYLWKAKQTRESNRTAVCDSGFFALSRHPNYFGDIIIQWSIFMIAVSAAADGYVHGQAYKALYASILGPVFITLLLLFVSGMPLAERPKAKDRYEKGNNWAGYKRWLDRTSPLIPFPPQLYARVPVFLKRSVFLELPMYVFDPAKHSDVATPGGGSDGGDSTGRGNQGRESAEQRLV
ncbi:oxidoreductase [Beauveria brongniartii RCEF 3172]|uniref:Oxidoreductase n=1 Tax=Beauveria brongniartii RCEF 3172 TaxID=1081107 RepID=A0A167F1F0_9HYPO|nr:oxidoreductase [Beauveria brongniartii RCEF 3172]